MKQNLVIISIFTLVLFSCNSEAPKEKEKARSKFEMLSEYYKDTVFSELFVYPDEKDDASHYHLAGKQIDSATIHTLGEYATHGRPWTEGFYGIYSFKLDDEHTGLLTRTPGEYSPTTISLWIYDHKNDSISNNVQLADVFGDAGEIRTINSYLFLNRKKPLSALTYIFSSYDHSVEDINDSTIEEHNYYSLSKINFSSLDTISTDSSKLKQEYKAQLIKMEGY